MSIQQNNRRIFRIEVGNIPADTNLQDYIQQVKDRFKRQPPLLPFVEPLNNVYKRELLIERKIIGDDGCVKLKYNPLHMHEDYFIPLREGY